MSHPTPTRKTRFDQALADVLELLVSPSTSPLKRAEIFERACRQLELA
jgi:hypothetical protein